MSGSRTNFNRLKGLGLLSFLSWQNWLFVKEGGRACGMTGGADATDENT